MLIWCPNSKLKIPRFNDSISNNEALVLKERGYYLKEIR